MQVRLDGVGGGIGFWFNPDLFVCGESKAARTCFCAIAGAVRLL